MKCFKENKHKVKKNNVYKKKKSASGLFLDL